MPPRLVTVGPAHVTKEGGHVGRSLPQVSGGEDVVCLSRGVVVGAVEEQVLCVFCVVVAVEAVWVVCLFGEVLVVL